MYRAERGEKDYISGSLILFRDIIDLFVQIVTWFTVKENTKRRKAKLRREVE